MNNKRTVVKFAGESGQGISSVGSILAKALKQAGYKVFEYREYPSLIRGGFASSQLEISDTEMSTPSEQCDILICISRMSIHKYLPTVKEGGTVIHSLTRVKLSEEEEKLIIKKNIDIHYVDALEKSRATWGDDLFANIVLIGLVWNSLDLEFELLKVAVEEKFAKKPDLLKLDIEAIEYGFQMNLPDIRKRKLNYQQDLEWKDSLLIEGNEAIALGAIAAGVRVYYGYPMTPSTSIMATLSKYYRDTGIIVKQAEDEITAANMAVGSMFAGTRALTGTSGGGFDLMTETVSLAGITETPFVCVLAQRPGPATGLPTWTGAGDLNVALYAGHGEFPRVVMAASDAVTSYELVQQAMNIAEEYQCVVILLTEKQIAENMYNIKSLPEPIEIKRGLLENQADENLLSTDRFKITDSGVSPRWLPGTNDVTYLANSDEHLEDGTLTEEADASAAMYDKRMRKEQTILNTLPEPVLHWGEDAKHVLIGWGSSKTSVLDAFLTLDEVERKNISYLHFDYIHPLRTEKLIELKNSGMRFHLLEANYTGQLGNYITQKTGIQFDKKFLKYDGRPFYLEETMRFLLDLSK